MKNRILRKIIAFIMSLIIAVGGLLPLVSFAESDKANKWSIDAVEFAGGIFGVKLYTVADGQMSLFVDGKEIIGGEVIESEGYRVREFSVDTASYADGKKTLSFLLNGETVLEKQVYFDNTAPYIPSWDAIGPEGKYTAYDMTVWPDDVLVLNGDMSFDIDFSPSDGEGSGVASITAKLNSLSIPVPFTVEYDYLKAGFHTISYTITDNVGNSYTRRFRFETKKPEPAYADSSVALNDKEYTLSSVLSGDFENYTAKFYLAELLSVKGFENITENEVTGYSDAGEMPFLGKTNGAFITATTNGKEIYHCFDIDVSGKVGSLYGDYNGEIPKGSKAELSVYSHNDGKWESIITKTSHNGTVALSLGKKGIGISEYAKDGVIRARVRVISELAEKYIKTTSFIPSIRFNSQIGETQHGASGSTASVIYSGRVTSDLGWYIRGEADYFYSYSPTYTFDLPSENKLTLKQFDMTFSGDTFSRVALTWQTDEESGTRVQLVEYGDIRPDFSSALTYTGSTKFATETGYYSHKIRITGLTPGEKYWVRYGDSATGIWSDAYLLEMPDRDPSFSFAAASPSFGSDAERNWDLVYWSSAPDLLLTSGNEASSEEEWDKYFESMQKAFMSARVVPAAGAQSSASWWTKYNLSEQSGAGHANGVYYSFKYKNSLFAVLNSNDLDSEGRLGKAQFNWLKKVLADQDADWKFVLLNASLSGETQDSVLSSQLCPIFTQYGVDVVFSEGGYSLSGSLGDEIFTYNGKNYFSNANVLYIDLPSMSDGFIEARVNGTFFELSYGKESVSLFSSSRIEWIAERVNALPEPSNITLDHFNEITELCALCDTLDGDIAQLFVIDYERLTKAEEKLAQLLLVTPPDITVSWKVSKRVVLLSELELPNATATDLSDGRCDVSITVTDPEGDELQLDGRRLTPEKSGVYTVIYSSVDKDGNTATREYTFAASKADFCDLDGDGELSIADALTALRLAVKIIAVDDVYIACGDTDNDGIITVSDALFILERVVGRKRIDQGE